MIMITSSSDINMFGNKTADFGKHTTWLVGTQVGWQIRE